MTRSENIEIREFRLSDLTALQRLIYQTIDVCYSSVYPPRAVQFFKGFHSEKDIMRRKQEEEILVIERKGTIIATGAIVGNDIFGVFVDPQYQGCGYDKLLMHKLENKAKASGCTELVLSVSLPSKRFYKSLGYEILDACSLDVGEGQRLNYWKARKRMKEKES